MGVRVVWYTRMCVPAQKAECSAVLTAEAAAMRGRGHGMPATGRQPAETERAKRPSNLLMTDQGSPCMWGEQSYRMPPSADVTGRP